MTIGKGVAECGTRFSFPTQAALTRPFDDSGRATQRTVAHNSNRLGRVRSISIGTGRRSAFQRSCCHSHHRPANSPCLRGSCHATPGPNTFVDANDEWPQAIAWLAKLMALVRNEPFDPDKPDGTMRTKESISAYRGPTCGVRYAEAFRSANAYPQAIV